MARQQLDEASQQKVASAAEALKLRAEVVHLQKEVAGLYKKLIQSQELEQQRSEQVRILTEELSNTSACRLGANQASGRQSQLDLNTTTLQTSEKLQPEHRVGCGADSQQQNLLVQAGFEANYEAKVQVHFFATITLPYLQWLPVLLCIYMISMFPDVTDLVAGHIWDALTAEQIVLTSC